MITICRTNAMQTFHLTPEGWSMLEEWIERWQSATATGAVIVDGDYYEWDVAGTGPASCYAALRTAVGVLLMTKDFVDDRRACDNPMLVLHQIPTTLKMRAFMGETPHSFTELVRWASHDV